MAVNKFATPVPIIQLAFDEIMRDVDLPEAQKAKIFNKYRIAHRKGLPREEEEAFAKVIKQDFAWPWFDQWEAFFRQRNVWPYLWQKWPACRCPSTVEEVCRFFNVDGLKAVMDRLGISHSGMKKRDELVQRLCAITLAEMFAVEGVEGMLLERFQGEVGDGLEVKIMLLCHSITMRAYSLRDQAQRQGEASDFGERQYEVIVAIAGCPVEAEVARRFNANLERGLPPFFPGDRSHVTLKNYGRMVAAGFNTTNYKRRPLFPPR